MRQIRIGKIVLTDGGRWDATKGYPVLTFVRHNGDGWWSYKANINSEPSPSNTNWIQATDTQEFINALKKATSDAEEINEAISRAEEIRTTAENERIEAETDRKAKETERQQRESERQQSETIRQQSETQRNQAEQQRIEAENNRDGRYEQAEEHRNELYSAEEAKRNHAEQEREQAETIRRQTFEKAMTDVDTATKLAEDKADEAQTQANHAKTQGDYAKTQGDGAKRAKEDTEQALKSIPTLSYNSEDGCLYATDQL